MNSNYGKNTFDFDLGIGSNKPRSLNDQKNNKTPQYSYNSQQPKPSWQPNKPSWTHQPAPTQSGSLNDPTSMVGDIFGKSWGSTSASGSSSGLGIGIVEKNPNLFGDLVSSALGGGKGGNNGNVPLKNAAPVNSGASGISNKSPYSMGNLANSLPNTGNSDGVGGYSSGYSSGGVGSSGVNVGVNAMGGNKSGVTNLGGPSMKSMAGGIGGGGIGMNANKDPFSNLTSFGLKPQSGGLNSANKGSAKVNKVDDAFGDFQNATKPSTASFPSGGVGASNSMPSPAFETKMGGFGMPSAQSQTPVQSSGIDQFDVLFSSSGSGSAGASASGGFGVQESAEVDDWGFGGGDDSGMTTELDGLPPPPAGVSAASAKNKGTDNYKQGQYPDAIKWLSWAVILLEKAGEHESVNEILACRASCYKEVGEYKKAVADCTKVLEHDDANVAVLVQRALLYESMEKYRLGAEDLRTVLKMDPGNRIARSTIHRLTKMAE